jgi:hypothetical protein
MVLAVCSNIHISTIPYWYYCFCLGTLHRKWICIHSSKSDRCLYNLLVHSDMCSLRIKTYVHIVITVLLYLCLCPVSNVSSFYGMSVPDCPFSFFQRAFTYTMHCLQTCSGCLYNLLVHSDMCSLRIKTLLIQSDAIPTFGRWIETLLQ